MVGGNSGAVEEMVGAGPEELVFMKTVMANDDEEKERSGYHEKRGRYLTEVPMSKRLI